MDLTHGVVYTPHTLQLDKWNPDRLNESGCNYVRIYWVDLANTRRCRILPIEHFKALLKSNRPGVNIAKVTLGVVYLTLAPGFAPIGEYLYAIDIASLRPCPFAPGHFAVLGQFEEKTALTGPNDKPSVEVNLCPRTLLRRITQELKQSYNTEFLVGFETEFILLKSTDPVEPASIHDFSASVGLLAGSLPTQILQEIADALVTSGIKLEMYHTEAAPGQYEIVGVPRTPLEAADALVFTREIIVQIAGKHGLHASFAPRPFMYSAGSSTHAHISVHNTSGEPKPADEMSKHESAFLAGLMAHLPAIVALTLPTSASYARMTDGVWSGGTYVNWGTENREAPVRLTNFHSPSSRNFELRFIDGTANPHIALAAVLAAGLIGIRDSTPLEVKDCSGTKSAAELTEEERKTLGITTRMSLSLAEARAALEKDSELSALLGADFIEAFSAVNKTLDAELNGHSESKEQKLTRLVKFY
ncbi:1,2-dihydroxy-3-keto-5-methylthiopentene dioxygenase [Favolaschia claudopus]|uniref:Glutamine synthetase n=1 Tax=Favolaschia claudopus TaxID=2862362 RepID=A0AAW0C2H7_9AGAR